MVEIDKKLYQEIKDYCKLNDLVIKDFVNKLLRKALTVEKYGDKPFSYENGTIVDNKKKQNGIIPLLNLKTASLVVQNVGLIYIMQIQLEPNLEALDGKMAKNLVKILL